VDKPISGELRNVDVQMVSLVHKGANRRQFKIFKSAEWPEDSSNGQDADRPEEQEMRGFFQVLKQFFTGGVKKEDEAQIPTFAQAMQAKETTNLIWDSFSTLRSVIRAILESKANDKIARITGSIEEFKAHLVGKLNQIGIAKALELYTEEPVEKAGRKVSAARLKALKDAHSILAQIIAEAEADNQDGEGTQVTKEELAKMVAEAVNEATKPISERLEKLEKQADGKPEAGQEKDDLQEVIKEAVAQAVKPLEDRLEVVEKARGISNKVPEEKDKVEKSESFWGGVFIG